MTAVFTDAVPDIKIKVEPGLVTVKKEKIDVEETPQINLGEEKDKEQKETGGELFNQLVGEVNKLNDDKVSEISKHITITKQ